MVQPDVIIVCHNDRMEKCDNKYTGCHVMETAGMDILYLLAILLLPLQELLRLLSVYLQNATA